MSAERVPQVRRSLNQGGATGEVDKVAEVPYMFGSRKRRKSLVGIKVIIYYMFPLNSESRLSSRLQTAKSLSLNIPDPTKLFGRLRLESLKKEFLELLDKDIEFRYAVAGYLGLSEILKRLDTLVKEQTRLAEEQAKTWEEIRSLREEQTKIWMEIERLREEQIRLREDMRAGFESMMRHIDALGAR